MLKKLLSLTALGAAAFLLSNCASAPGGATAGNYMTDGSRKETSRARSPMEACATPDARSGLATGWGRKVDDKVKGSIFERNSRTPVAVAKVFYNDQTGAYTMTAGDHNYTNSFRDYAGGIFRMGLRNHRGGALSAFQKGGNLVCLGESGERYSVEVENMSNHRLEFVVTVDGLDVLNGKTGSYHSRGYVLDPGQRREIKGWRTSMNEVATFRFGSVDKSYAGQKTGVTRNVGVIGCAVFSEKGTNPRPYAGTDSYRRLNADPFIANPGDSGFATPVE